MGFALSWIAVKGVPKEQVLAWMSLSDTGITDDAMEAPLTGAQIPGWYVVVAKNQLDFAREEHLFNLSRGCEVIGCVVEEHEMRCEVVCYIDANFAWRADYFGENGPDETALDSDGALPPEWAAIRDTQAGLQSSGDGSIDYLFDAPLELAKAVCGFRHDLAKYDWGRIAFTELHGAAPTPPTPEKSGGWLKGLFGR
ncbi:MAG TPA: hypothetical protein DCL54_04700 [Alphaproteobacteria bacterium]|nr:hypothetical protein [Alphaproteobacteria bacterium]HAJ45864.1 hypothetical protein [Alphaproteobacteria bacterium]